VNEHIEVTLTYTVDDEYGVPQQVSYVQQLTRDGIAEVISTMDEFQADE
jgi:hypothetical protein